ncbi:MAG: response regulator transcription factor [Acidobacteriota bacterium]
MLQELDQMNSDAATQGVSNVRVAIVEDDRIAREGLRLIINATPGYSCTQAYTSIEDGMRGLATDVPDVLLLDIHLPGMSGAEGVRLFREKYPSVQVLMLTNYSDDDKVFESICNGACGYMLKKTAPARLLEAIAEAAAGGAPMSPEIAKKVVELFRKTRAPAKVEQALTPHEVRLLGMLAQGYTYQGAGEKLSVSINTVRNYVRSIYEKLHVHSKSEAVSKALRGGIL